MIIFTDHARIRMTERSVSRVQVMHALQTPDRIIEEDNIRIFRKRIEDATLEVVAEIKKREVVIITLYWL